MERYQKMPVRTTVMMSSGAGKTPMPILITQRSDLVYRFDTRKLFSSDFPSNPSGNETEANLRNRHADVACQEIEEIENVLAEDLKVSQIRNLMCRKSPMRGSGSGNNQVIIERFVSSSGG